MKRSGFILPLFATVITRCDHFTKIFSGRLLFSIMCYRPLLLQNVSYTHAHMSFTGNSLLAEYIFLQQRHCHGAVQLAH